MTWTISRAAATMPHTIPSTSGANAPATDTASAIGAANGSAMVETSVHGRDSRPDTSTMRPASHRLNELIASRLIAAAGGDITTNMSSRRPRSSGVRVPPPAEAGISAADHLVEELAQAGADGLLIGADLENGDRDDGGGEPRGPEHDAADRVPFDAALARRGPREQREIGEPPGRHGHAEQEAREEQRCRASCRGRPPR